MYKSEMFRNFVWGGKKLNREKLIALYESLVIHYDDLFINIIIIIL